MKTLPEEIVRFFKAQGHVIVNTLDKDGLIHASAKGIGEISQEGRVLLVDLYEGRTMRNIKSDPRVSITAVDESQFLGFALKGKGRIIPFKDIPEELLSVWKKKIIERITKRMIRNVRDDRKTSHSPEAHLPRVRHLIEVIVEKVVDLAPGKLKKAT